MTLMRVLNIALGLTMLGFAGVQYNDPDMPQWVLMYTIPALWMYVVTFRLQSVKLSIEVTGLLWASVVFYVVAVVFYWPAMPNFWLKEVWIVEETAREGMGLMIALVVVLVALLNTRLQAAERRSKGRGVTAQTRHS
ncbi:MAG: transmembrane 220 family protein [Burkholderiaceae bacterium]